MRFLAYESKMFSDKHYKFQVNNLTSQNSTLYCYAYDTVINNS